MTSLLPSPSSKYHESSSSNRPSTLLFNDASNLDERELAKQAFELAEESLQSQCLENATTFVSVERRGIALQASLQRLLQEECVVVETVAQVRQDLTMQSDNNNSKAKQLQEISQTHQQRRRTLLQHSTLLELLELPNVMDACIRSDLYDEALNIASFANTLERRHDISAANNNNTKGASVVAAVIEETRAREVELRHYLIQQFTKDITMPQCLELVTALRRLNGIELERTNNNNNNTSRMDRRSGGTADLEGAHSAMELKLQVDFLEARDKWLEKTNMEVPLFLPSFTTTNSTNSNTTNASQQQNEQFLDWIERHRTKCFEIASQFLTIFCTPTSYSTVSDVTNTLTNTHQSTAYSLLSIWCTRRIHMFLSLLQTTQLDSPTALSYTSLSALRDALDATAFFAASMGRIGGDFTPLVTSVFETRVLRIVTRSWKEATESLDHTLRICREAGIASPLVNTNTTTAPSFQQQHRDEEVTAVNAPQALLTYPPLARFVNTFMTSLNDLRRCLLPGTFFPLRTNLTEEVIPNLKIILETNERKLLTPGMLRGDSIQLRQLATQYKSVLLEVVEPFLILALNIALGIPCSTTKEAIVDEEEDQGNTTSETGQEEYLMPKTVVGENDKENTNEFIDNVDANDKDDHNNQSEDNFCDDSNSKNAEEESK